MKVLTLTCATLLLAMSAVRGIDLDRPIDNMPILGNRIPDLERRIAELEKYIRDREREQGKGNAAPGAAPQARATPPKPLWTTLTEADRLLEAGKFEEACTAFIGAIENSFTEVDAAPADVKDSFLGNSFLACFSSATAVDSLAKKGERVLAKTLCEATLEGLRRVQKTLPGWNPKVVEYRLKKVEEQFAKLQ